MNLEKLVSRIFLDGRGDEHMIKKALYSYPTLSFRTHLFGSVFSQPLSSVITYHKGEVLFISMTLNYQQEGRIVVQRRDSGGEREREALEEETKGIRSGGEEEVRERTGGGGLRWRDVEKKHSDVIRVERLHPASHTHPSTYERFMSLLIQCRSAAGGGHGYWKSC